MFKIILRASVIGFIALASSIGLSAAATANFIITNNLPYDVNYSCCSTSAVRTTYTVPANGGTATISAAALATNAFFGSTMISFWQTGQSAYDIFTSVVFNKLKTDSNGNYGITLTTLNLYQPGTKKTTKTISTVAIIDSNFTYPTCTPPAVYNQAPLSTDSSVKAINQSMYFVMPLPLW